MNICLVTSVFPARSETFVLAQALGLADRGHHVRVLSHGPSHGITPEELATIKQNGIERMDVPRIPGTRRGNSGFYAKRILANPSSVRLLNPEPPWKRQELFETDLMFGALKRMSPDVIHVQFGITAALLLRIEKLRNLVVTWHGSDANLVPNIRGGGIYRQLFGSAAMHTANSRFLGQRLQHLGLPPSALTIVPMGIDLETFMPPATPRSRGQTLRILSVGRLEEVKGHKYLIEAVARLLGEGHQVSLRIVGEGEDRISLEARIEQLGIQHAVTLLGVGTSSLVLKEMQDADLFALTGVPTAAGPVETQGVVYAEAQATGLPVIGSNVGGVPDSLLDGESGYLCPPGDPQAIAEAICRFIKQPDNLEIFGKRGREFAIQNFGRDSMIDKFEEMYFRAAMASG